MYNVIIIGAGFTGMAAAALLSEKHSTLVIEKDSFIGGRAATRTPKEWGWADVDNYDVDFGHHVFATNNYIEYVINKTGADKYVNIKLVKRPLFYRFGKFHVPPIRVIEKALAYPFIPLNAKLKINKFLGYVEKVPFDEVMQRWLHEPLKALYDYFGFDDYGRELLTDGFAAGYQTAADAERNSAGDLILCMKAYLKGIKKHKTPLFAAEGGVGKIAEAFAKVTEGNGGKVLLNKTVKKIVVQNGEARGVVLDNGDTFDAKNILFTAPVYFIPNLISENEMPIEFREKLKKERKEATTLFLIMGGATRPLLDKPVGTWILIPKTEVKCVDSYYLVYEVDRELKQAPEGRYYVSFAVEPSEDDLKDKNNLIEKMIEDMSPIFPNFNFDKDFEWRSACYFPIVDGVKRTAEWYQERKLGPETPIKNLYIAGDSAHRLGTGVDGCVSSAIFAAEKITRTKLLNLGSFYTV